MLLPSRRRDSFYHWGFISNVFNMSTEAVVIYSDYKQVEKVKDEVKTSLTFNFIDITSKKGKKDGWTIKSYWGAKLDPFILIVKDGTPVKAFYSEDKKDPVDEAIKYLNT